MKNEIVKIDICSTSILDIAKICEIYDVNFLAHKISDGGYECELEFTNISNRAAFMDWYEN
jgi:hypothetical protein